MKVYVKPKRGTRACLFDTDKIYSLCDTILYSFYDRNRLTSVLYPIMAGITNKDAHYKIKRNPVDAFFRYTAIFEYVRSGRGYIECAGKKYEVKAGDTYILRPNIVAHYYADPDDPFEKEWINISGTFVESMLSVLNLHEEVIVVQLDSHMYFEKIFKILEEYNFSASDSDDLRLMHVLLDFLSEVHHIKDHKTKKSTADAQDIADFIDNNIRSKQMNTENICLHCYISRKTLERMFQKAFGITPKKYIEQRKIEQAKLILAETDFTVEKISEILNYSNCGYFRKTFTASCGMSPTTWRKSAKNDAK